MGDATRSDETVYQRSENGGFVPRKREVSESVQNGNQTSVKSAVYQPVGADGQMKLTEQTVSSIVKAADGSETVQTSLYGSSWSGRVGDNESSPALREQDIVERKPGPGGTVKEVLSVRRPSPSDPNKLGPAVQVSETVCTGKCSK